LINNRQNGRRRGRGGGPRSPNQSPSMGNRQDNRSRGNAAQLLEKYKALARDAQLQGDRVQSESFLQFAEHYYRVLNESRARFEEQRRQRDDYDEDEDQDESLHAEGDDGEDRESGDYREERSQRDERPRDDRPRDDRPRDDRPREDRPERIERPDRIERPERGDRPDRGGADRPRREFRAARPERPERNGEPRYERRPASERFRDERPREANAEDSEVSERIALDVLPPAIAPLESEAPAKAPRRRARRPLPDEGEEIAPAA
jgi:hypothetical protein